MVRKIKIYVKGIEIKLLVFYKETYELTCAEDIDCSQHFGNKIITAKCENKSCHCHDTLLKADIPCKPKVSDFSSWDVNHVLIKNAQF